MNAIVANFNNFFVMAFLKQDTKAVSIHQAALVASKGGNETIALQYFDTLNSLIMVLLNTPDTNQASQISQKVADLIKLTKELIASFPGMENFETSPLLMMDPENAAFYSLYNLLKSGADNLIADPASALAYFTNNVVQAKLAELVTLAIAVSQGIEQCKLFYFYVLES